MKLRDNWKATIYASYAGYITQAIVNSFLPLLFVQLQNEFGFSLQLVTFLVTFNFGMQLLLDLLSAKFVDRIGYRTCIVAAHIFSAAGLIMLGVLPFVLPVPYIGILISVIFYAVGGGLIEVLISPIVEACPTDDKASAMSMLHSFYCWGVVAVIVISTVFFSFAGISRWYIMAMLWALLPIVNGFVFSRVPIRQLTSNDESMSLGALFRSGVFWILMLMMLAAGASEQAMSQWASAFAEKALGVTKTAGDLAGPCMFSILMGISRVIHSKLSKINLRHYIIFCSALALAGYALAISPAPSFVGLMGCGIVGFAVGVMWPGTFSTAAVSMPKGGTALFAMLALAGDVGCSGGPTLTGLMAGVAGDNLKAGLLAAMIFPVMMIIGANLLGRHPAS